MTYILWDKTSSINGLTPEEVYANNPLYRDEDVYIFYRDDGQIKDAIPVSYLPNPEETNIDARCEAFIATITRHKTKSPTDSVTWDALAQAYNEGVNSIDE